MKGESMKNSLFPLCRGTYIILFFGLSLTLLSLACIIAHLYCPHLYESDTTRWLTLHTAEVIDTVLASLLLTIGGAFLFQLTYKSEKEK